MTAKHYNSYPEAPEILLESDGSTRLIRKRQAPNALWVDEIA
jgi:hypothetical protein